jgi:hypothetical protein
VETIRLTKDSPAVFAAVHNGSSNFIVHLVGPGTDESLINEIGSWSGEVLYARRQRADTGSRSKRTAPGRS